MNRTGFRPRTPTICMKCKNFRFHSISIAIGQYCTAPEVMSQAIGINYVTGEKVFSNRRSFPFAKDINTKGQCLYYKEGKPDYRE